MESSAPVQRRRLLSLREAAAFPNVPERTARRLIAERGLPAYRLGDVGTSIRVDELELRDWLEANPEGSA